jgi:hypothetical protein
MPANQKTTVRGASKAPKTRSARAPSARPRARTTALSRIQHNDRVISRAKKTLETTQKDLDAIRGSISTGGRDLRKDVAKLLRDTRRDLEKMNTSVRRDLKQLQKDLSPATKAKPRKPATNAKPRKPARKRAATARSSSR